MFETNQTVCHLCLQKSYVEGDRQRRLEHLRRESEAENPHALSCPECRVRVPETVSFCPGCGHQVRLLESRNSRIRRSPRPSNDRIRSRAQIPPEPEPDHRLVKPGSNLDVLLGAVGWFAKMTLLFLSFPVTIWVLSKVLGG